MAINLSVWDFDKTPFENTMASMIANNTIHLEKSIQFKEAFKGAKDANGNIGYIDIADWFHEEYGNQKPLCLGDKLIREIGRIGEQIGHEVERFYDDIEDEMKRVSSSAKDELQRELDDVVDAGERLGKDLENGWKKVFSGCC